jgi:hypothetical protein
MPETDMTYAPEWLKIIGVLLTVGLIAGLLWEETSETWREAQAATGWQRVRRTLQTAMMGMTAMAVSLFTIAVILHLV